MEIWKRVLLILVGIAASAGIAVGIYFAAKPGKSSEPDEDTSLQLLLKADNIAIHHYKSNRTLPTVILSHLYGIKSFTHFPNSTIFFANTKSYEPIRSTSPGFLTLHDITKTWTKTSMAADYVTGKVYVVDEPAGKVYVADTLSDHTKTLLTDLNGPKDIVLDLQMGIMFILESSSITQASMDGTQVSKILEKPNLTAFAIDTDLKILSFSDSKNISTFHYTDLPSNNYTSFIKPNVISMTIMDNRLVFITEDSSKNLDLYACPLKSDECDKLNFYRRIQTVQKYQVELPKVVNHCADSGCEQLCLLKKFGTYSCACSDGWKLDYSKKRCELEENLLVRTTHEIQKLSIMSKYIKSWAKGGFYKIVAFDSYEDHTAYFVTSEYTHWIHSTIDYNGILLPKDWSVSALAVDELTGKIYIMDRSAGRISVADVRQADGMMNVLITGLVKPLDVVLDPELGLMFVLHESSISRFSMDGTNKTEIFTSTDLIAITIDRSNKKLYITTTKNIVRLSYYANTPQKFYDLNVKMINDEITSLTYTNNQLYVVTTEIQTKSSKIQVCSLGYNEKEVCKLTLFHESEDILVVQTQRKRFINGWKHPCNEKNGGCEHMCLATNTKEGYNCLCKLGYEPKSELPHSCKKIEITNK